jgi:YOP protein translocation protein YscK
MDHARSSDRHEVCAGIVHIDRCAASVADSGMVPEDLEIADRSRAARRGDGGSTLGDWSGAEPAGMPTFCRMPAAYIHADRFLECIPDIPPPLAARLLGCARLHRNLSELILVHYRLEECTEADFMDARSRFALLDAEQLRRVGELAGGIWHAQSLRSIILGRALATVLADFEPQLHGLALENVDLSPEPKRPLDPVALAEAIRRDGMHCLSAFLAGLSAPLRRRVLLKFPNGSPVGAPVSELHAALGPVIIDRIAARVLLP